MLGRQARIRSAAIAALFLFATTRVVGAVPTAATPAITALSTGLRPTCVVMGGAVSCWGFNADGELGNGGSTDSSKPITVTGLASGAKAVSAGYYHTCALTSAGGVRCWGPNT